MRLRAREAGRPGCFLIAALAVLLSIAGAAGGRARAGDEAPATKTLWDEIRRGEVSGFVATDARWFVSPAPFPGQDRSAINPGVVLQPEYRYEWNGSADRVTLVPFARIDFDDAQRMHWDLRELNWLHAGSSWEVRFGVGKVFWGVTESVHLVDIVNQTDTVEDFDGEDKLGQPMLKLGLFHGWGTLELFFLPRFRERTFPGKGGRLRFSLPVDTDAATYESSLAEWHPDAAVRWSQSMGDWDLGLSHFAGTTREPRFFIRIDPSGTPQVIPRYDLIQQTSLDVQATKGSWLWKLEAMTRSGHGSRFAALVAGFEYTFYGVLGTAADAGLLAEYLYDGRDDATVPTGGSDAVNLPIGKVPPVALPPALFTETGLSLGSAPPTVLENDFFGGVRLTLNDVQSTSLLAGAIVDADTQTTAMSIEASRRVGDRWTLELEARVFVNVATTDLLFAVRDDNHLQVRVARYF